MQLQRYTAKQWHQCWSTFPFLNRNKKNHRQLCQKVVFRMALELFPNFTLPNPVMTIDDDEDDIRVVDSPAASKTSLNNNIISALKSQVGAGSPFPLPSDTLIYPAPYTVGFIKIATI